VTEGRGVVIVELVRRSPADRAGIEPGDVVVAVDGRHLADAAQLRNELARAEVGSELRLTILRNGRRREIRVPVEEAKPDA
jgi:S1-C subfamily serine protease